MGRGGGGGGLDAKNKRAEKKLKRATEDPAARKARGKAQHEKEMLKLRRGKKPLSKDEMRRFEA